MDPVFMELNKLMLTRVEEGIPVKANKINNKINKHPLNKTDKILSHL